MRLHKPLYNPEQRARRDATVWTLVQGILAPVQFLVCLISLVLVIRYLLTGSGYVVGDHLNLDQDCLSLPHHDYGKHLGESGIW
jgi:hypothetical protein